MPAFENVGYNAIYTGLSIILSAFLQFNLKIVLWNYFFQRDMHICEKRLFEFLLYPWNFLILFFPPRSQSYPLNSVRKNLNKCRGKLPGQCNAAVINIVKELYVSFILQSLLIVKLSSYQNCFPRPFYCYWYAKI